MTSVSVIIPTYNRSNVIRRAIESAIDQTYTPDEIIVVDDGSTDRTRNIMAEYLNKYDNIEYIRHETNKGQNYARNTGIRAATGDIISYLDSDDEFYPKHIEKVVNSFNDLPNDIGGILTGYHLKNSNNVSYEKVYEPGYIHLEDLANGNRTCYCSALSFKKNIIKDIGLHDTDIIRGTDTDFFIQILEQYKLYGIESILFAKYQESNNRVGQNYSKIIEGTQALLNKHGDKFNAAQKSQQFANIGMAYIKNGNKSQAEEWLSRIKHEQLPNDTYYSLSRAHIEMGYMRTARKYSKLGISKNPTNIKHLLMFLITFMNESFFTRLLNMKRNFESIKS